MGWGGKGWSCERKENYLSCPKEGRRRFLVIGGGRSGLYSSGRDRGFVGGGKGGRFPGDYHVPILCGGEGRGGRGGERGRLGIVLIGGGGRKRVFLRGGL